MTEADRCRSWGGEASGVILGGFEGAKSRVLGATGHWHGAWQSSGWGPDAEEWMGGWVDGWKGG